MEARLKGDRYATAAAGGTRDLGTGAVGDILRSVVLVPATTAPGAVQIKDGADAAITIYTGGTVSAELQPIKIEFGSHGITSRTGKWQLVMGANVSAVASGSFTP